jgi:hypothetical protein
MLNYKNETAEDLRGQTVIGNRIKNKAKKLS